MEGEGVAMDAGCRGDAGVLRIGAGATVHGGEGVKVRCTVVGRVRGRMVLLMLVGFEAEDSLNDVHDCRFRNTQRWEARALECLECRETRFAPFWKSRGRNVRALEGGTAKERRQGKRKAGTAASVGVETTSFSRGW